MVMFQYKCDFSVNGRRTQMIVSAMSMIDAKKIVEAQYQNCKIVWYNCVRV